MAMFDQYTLFHNRWEIFFLNSPINKLTHDNVTKAELGMENTKLKGYMRGTEAQPYNNINNTSGKMFSFET